MNRRELMKMSTAAAAGLMLHKGAFAAAKPSTVLIFGGTGFIGPHFVRELHAGGHKVTLFNRGKRNPGLFPDVETLIGDRNVANSVDVLKGRKWDVVIDDSGYFPGQVTASTSMLKDNVQHYIFVSSISAYADMTPAGIDEDYKLASLDDPDAKQITEKNYGGLKAACEQIVEKTFGTRQAVIRPTYIVGPGDHTDRFTYWPWRVARGGEMFVPGAPEDPIQFIDVRDLAEFMRRCVEERIGGRYNLCNPAGAVTMGDLLETSKRVTQANTKFRWAPLKFLEENKLLESGELTTWSPPTGEYAGASLVSSARAVSKGLRFRNVETTVRDLLAWHEQRPADQKQKLRAGMTPEREAELLKKLPA
jgi:2'-hydroxyisoflavone reductase